MKDDIRKKTCLIIRKNHEFLQGRILYSRDLKWSRSPYDAWRTRDIEKAEEYARKTGGIVMLFNPIVNQMRVMKEISMDKMDKIADEVMNRIQKRPQIVRMTIIAEPKREGIERKHIENVYDINLLADGVRYVMAIRSKQTREQVWPDREYLCLDDYDITVHQCYPDD